jgi:hypothetical protein
VLLVGGTNATADICYKNLSILQRSVFLLPLHGIRSGSSRNGSVGGGVGGALRSRRRLTSPHGLKGEDGYAKAAGNRAEWVEVSELPTPRGFLAAAVLGDTLYTLGGYNGTVDTRCIETFDLITKSWRRCSGL